MVGQTTTGTPSLYATALAVSSTLPPPTPTMTSAPAALAACAMRSISVSEHSPPNDSKVIVALERSKPPSIFAPTRSMPVLVAIASAAWPSGSMWLASSARASGPWIYLLGLLKMRAMEILSRNARPMRAVQLVPARSRCHTSTLSAHPSNTTSWSRGASCRSPNRGCRNLWSGIHEWLMGRASATAGGGVGRICDPRSCVRRG